VKTDGLLHYGGENTIRVVADNSMLPNSRWYSGSGIYRPVWLWVGQKLHIDIEGVKISTLSYSPARIKIETGCTGGSADVEILYNGERVVGDAGGTVTLDIPNAKLWSDETPDLYQCRVTLKENGVTVDEVTETFGIRLVEWSCKGLFINGRETLLRGGCIHHDNGILGARSFAESEVRRIRILKRAGFNAVRSAHNPAAAALLKACDKYGMYVMDETWDMWYLHKNKFDYASVFAENYTADIEAVVRRDFNHPSVIMYSIGNEVTEPHEERGIGLMKEMAEYVRSLDKTRAVTCGVNLALIFMASKGKGVYKEAGEPVTEKNIAKRQINSTMFNLIASVVGTGMNKLANLRNADGVTSPCLDVLDIAGYNYASGRYPLEGKAHPNRIVA
jgi:beta-galactosidase/beta-glucuronidase